MQSSGSSETAGSSWAVNMMDTEEVVAEIVVSESCDAPLMVAMQPVQEAAEVVVMTETEGSADKDKQEVHEFGEGKNVVSVEPEINVEDDGEEYQEWYIKGRRKDDVEIASPKKKKRGRPSAASRLLRQQEEEDEDDDMYVPLTPAPRKPPNRNPHRLLWNDSDMVKAIKAVKDGKISKRGAARKYNVPYSTLKDRLSGRVQHGTKPGVRKVMSDKEEKELAHYVKDMQNCGFTVNSTMIRERAAEILRLNHGPNTQYWRTVPGVNWFTGFLKRHSDRNNHKPISFSRQFNRQVTYSLKAKRQLLNMFYDMLERQMRSWKLLGKPEKIFSVEVVKSSIYNSDTILLCCSASGNVLPPFVTLTGSKEDDELKEGMDAYPDAHFTCRRSRNVTPELFSTWFTEHFSKHVPETRKCILLVSGQSKFFTVSLMRNMKAANMTLLNIPAQMASILHPIDQSLIDIVGSTLLEKRNNWEEENPEKSMDLATYAHMLKKTWRRIPANNIRSSFQKAGIYPFSRTAVVDSYLLMAGERTQVNDLSFQEGEDEFGIENEFKLEPEEEDLINDGPQVQVQLYDEESSQRPTLEDLTEAVAYRTMQEERQNASKALDTIKDDSVCVTNGGDTGMTIEPVMSPSGETRMPFSSVTSTHTRLDSVQSQPPEVLLNPSPDKRSKDGPITTLDIDQQEIVQNEEVVKQEEVLQQEEVVQQQEELQQEEVVQQQEVVQHQEIVQQDSNNIMQPEYIQHIFQQDVVHQEVVGEEVVQEEVISQDSYPQSLEEVVIDNNQILNDKDIIYATNEELVNLQMLQGDNVVYIISEDNQDVGDNVTVDSGDLNNVIVTSNEQLILTQPTSPTVLPSIDIHIDQNSTTGSQPQSNVRIVQSYTQVQNNAKAQGQAPKVKISPKIQRETDSVLSNRVVHVVSSPPKSTPKVQPPPRVLICNSGGASQGGATSIVKPASPPMVSLVKKPAIQQQSIIINAAEPTKILPASGASLRKSPSVIRNPQGFKAGDGHKVTIKHSQIVTASENSGDIITQLTTPKSPNRRQSPQGRLTLRVNSNDKAMVVTSPTNVSPSPQSPKAGQAVGLSTSIPKSPTVTSTPQSPTFPAPKSPIVSQKSPNLKTTGAKLSENVKKNIVVVQTNTGGKQVIGRVEEGVFVPSSPVSSTTTELKTITLPKAKNEELKTSELKTIIQPMKVTAPKGDKSPRKGVSPKGETSPKSSDSTNKSTESPTKDLPRTRGLKRAVEQSNSKPPPPISSVVTTSTGTTPTKITSNIITRSSPRHKSSENKSEGKTQTNSSEAPSVSSGAPSVSATLPAGSSPYGTRSKRLKLQ